MAEINAQMVKQLRDATNLGIMECKNALVESGGDVDKAIQILREKGELAQAKRAGRETGQGVIASSLQDGSTGTLVEVNCETDFVAKNEKFGQYVQDIADKAVSANGDLADVVAAEITGMVQEIGENIVVGRNARYELDGDGVVSSYIHMGGKVGVLIEVGCEKGDTVSNDLFSETVRDVLLHIAAAGPQYIASDEVPEDVVSAEREIYAKQVEGKPENIIDQIVNGKLNKFFSQVCLLKQDFVKDTDMTIEGLLAARGKELDDTLTVRRFDRYQIGG